MASPRFLNRVSRLFVGNNRQPSDIDEGIDVDSMFSSLSTVRGNPSSPAPLRTVRLDLSSPDERKEEVDAAFDKLMQEFDLGSIIGPKLPELTTEQKRAMLQSSMSIRSNSKSTALFGRFDTLSNSSSGTSNGSSSGNSSSHRHQKPAATRPEYLIKQLRARPVRELDESDLVSLRIFLRSGAASWTTEFLDKGGYELLTDLFRQFKEAPKRMPQDDKYIKHLLKCLKVIMKHNQGGTARVLTQTEPLEYIRDLLFGPVDIKRKGLYSLHILTRQQLLDVLCTLLEIQTTQPHYIHGYNVLRSLLIDKPADIVEDDIQRGPFRMGTKADPETVMRVIAPGVKRPRYTAWMRELQFTVDRHIEPMTYLAQVLGYNFESAYRQLKLRQHQNTGENNANISLAGCNDPQPTVMTEEGVVDYLIANLRLICTLVSKPSLQDTQDKYEREKMRLEFMLSGFDKVAKCLHSCPHPTLNATYSRYLDPLLAPWADLGTVLREPTRRTNNNDNDDDDDDDDQWVDEE
ncbi:armadillo-type protein [Dichotomocladium elegans]|nr:armadillo-type protein [Dichotomocladium elegans]